MTKIRVIATALIALAFTAGCSSSTGGSPAPAAKPTVSDPPSIAGLEKGMSHSNIGQAPKVASPVDPGGSVKNPCALLTAKQLSQAQGKPGKIEAARGSSPATCSWDFGPNGDILISAHIDPGSTGSGLSDLYVGKQQGNYKSGVFEPTTVAGYPAVYTNPFRDERAQGQCDIEVGIRDDVYLDVQVGAENAGKHSCDYAANTAEQMITTMKNGG